MKCDINDMENGSLLQYYVTSSGVTTAVPSILNLIMETSTSINSDKLFKTTTLNSSHLFLFNNVNTESLHSNSASEECKNSDCTKSGYVLQNADNSSSSASKILWNLVSTVKNTTELSESEVITVPLYFPVNAYSSNNTIVNNASFYSNDNELDSEIDSDNEFLEAHSTHIDKFMNNVLSLNKYNNFTVVSTEPTMMTTEILFNEVNNFEENNTVIQKVTEMYPQTSFYDYNTSDNLNITNYETALMTEKATTYADDELDFITHFLDVSESDYTSNANSFNKDIDSKPYFFQNLTTEMPYESEASSVNDNSNTLIFVNNDTLVKSDWLKSKSTERDVNISELHVSSSDDNIERSENSSSVYPDYETSLDIQKLQSKVSRMIDILDLMNDTTNMSTGVVPPTTTSTNLNIIVSDTTAVSLNHTDNKTTINNDIFAENLQLNEKSTTENTVSLHFRSIPNISERDTANIDSIESNDSTGITKPMNNLFNLTLEDNTTKESVSTLNYFSMLDKANEKSTFSTSKTHEELTQIVNFNLRNSETTDSQYVLATTQQSYSSYESISEILNQNASLFENNRETESDDKRTTVTKSHDDFTNNNNNVSVVNLNKIENVSASKDINDTDYSLSSREIVYSTSFDTSSVETHSVLPTIIDSSFTASSVGTNIVNQISNTLTEDTFQNNKTNTKENFIYRLTSTESSEIKSSTLNLTSKINVMSIENYTESNFTPLENLTVLLNVTESVPEMQKKASNETLETSFTTKPSLSSENAELYLTETEKSITADVNNYHSEDKIFSISKTQTEVLSVTDSTYFNTSPVSNIHEIDFVTDFSSTVNETHREGKHIPFSSTLVRRTTAHPILFNVTSKIHPYPTHIDTSEQDLDNLHYNQIKAEELSPEERTNLINAVLKFSDKHYSKKELIERMAVIHLWLLHAVADEYKNATLNLSATNDAKTDEIEFENLPQILYVLPSPEIFLPNISFTFVVHNKWRNETFPADIILTILNLHAENLKKILVDIEEIHFSQGLLLQKHDLVSVIIEKYGIILLSTCLITVGMILLLVCIVIYYRKKTRHSAHCLTDDKLHRNMQEALGIDLNPAVIILQEEIREKATLNGSKVCSLDGDEGWLAPITDVPVEDNNAPFVQDTKL